MSAPWHLSSLLCQLHGTSVPCYVNSVASQLRVMLNPSYVSSVALLFQSLSAPWNLRDVTCQFHCISTPWYEFQGVSASCNVSFKESQLRGTQVLCYVSSGEFKFLVISALWLSSSLLCQLRGFFGPRYFNFVSRQLHGVSIS